MSPLVGTECCKGERQSLGHCQEMARQGFCAFPLHILKYMETSSEDRRGIEYSVTSIIGCARRAVLQKRVDYYEHPDRVVARFVGDAVHRFADDLNRDEPGYIGEQRLHVEVDLASGRDIVSFNLSGKPDQVWWYTKIVDLKTVREIPKQPEYEHEAQVNCYAWLMAKHDVEITAGMVTYISPNRQQQVSYPIALWPLDRTEHLIRLYLEPYLPWRLDGTYPLVLWPRFTFHADKTVTVKRDWHCDVCPVRIECDRIAEEERGVSPNDVRYWQPSDHVTTQEEPSFVDGF